MTKSKILLLLQSLICVLTAVMLAAAAIRIYREGVVIRAADPGASIYTPEKIRAALIPVIPVVCIGVIVTAVCAVLGIRDENADRPAEDTELARDLVCSRVAEPSEEMKKERELQKKLKRGGWAGALLCMIPVCLYIADPAHFAEGDAKGLDLAIRTLAGSVFPWIFAAFCLLAASTVQQEKSMKREKDLASARIREEKERGVKSVPEVHPLTGQMPEGSRLRNLRLAVLAAAVIFLAAGILNGGMRDVLIKAINVCSECIGLG